MLDKTFQFVVDLQCHLVTGEIDTLFNFKVSVKARAIREARDDLHSVATEMVHDDGGNLLDAPLDFLEVLNIREEP